MKRFTLCAATFALAIAAAGCQKAAPALVSQAAAEGAADATQAAWISMDLAKVLAAYSKDVVAFDPAAAPLATDWATFEKFNQGFVDMKFDGITVPDRKIQILDADTFVVSGTGTMTSKEGQVKSADMRFTDVYQKQADGKWLIVNEHVSFKPKETP
jgi:ketosteroid isomerase-like protein